MARLNDQLEDICPVEGLARHVLPAALAAVACGLWAGIPSDVIATALIRGERLPEIVSPERAGEARAPASLRVIERSEAAERAGEARAPAS
jgi:hypothetical protein